LHIGTLLAERYRLERVIGEGASSWVFAAIDLRLEREVAVKLLKRRSAAEHSAERVQFVQEARMLAKLAHPHVVAVYDAGETAEGDGYLVMELSQAGTLEAELLRRGALDVGEALSLIVPLLGALACVHDLGIIHRDLKPANIALVRHVGGKPRAKLLDFGIAQLSGKDLATGVPAGTPAYMSPEQARAESPGPAADVWAMGAVLFRCLTGRLPFDASASAGAQRNLGEQRAARIQAFCPNLPPHVAIVVERALEPDVTQRYPDTRAFARVLGVACRQDGVRLDANPEPIGLPDFAAWLTQADIETTQPELVPGAIAPLAASPSESVARRATAAVAPVALLESVAPRRSSSQVVLWALAAFFAGLVALWGAIIRPGSPSESASRAEHKAARQVILQGARWLAPEDATELQPASAPLPAAVSKTELQRQGAERQIGAVPVRRRASKSAGSATAVRPMPSEEHSKGTAPGLIADWEW
jgi:serine/threonine-protein kinase